MKAFLMAAGMGTRISSKTNQPKSLLNIGNGSLIKHTVELLQKNNIEVVIILGYKREMIKEELQGYKVTFIDNPFYQNSNSIVSLWLARNEISGNEDIILANADVFWKQDIMDQVLQNNDDVVFLADKTRRLTGDYFFQCENGILRAYGKELKEEDRTSEYVGIAKIKKTFVKEMFQQLDDLIFQSEFNLWWENTLYSLVDKKDIKVEDVDGKFWSEIDVIEDYERIVKYIKEQK